MGFNIPDLNAYKIVIDQISHYLSLWLIIILHTLDLFFTAQQNIKIQWHRIIYARFIIYTICATPTYYQE